MTRPTTSPASGALTPAHRASLPRGRILRSASDALSQPPWHFLANRIVGCTALSVVLGQSRQAGRRQMGAKGPSAAKVPGQRARRVVRFGRGAPGERKVTPNVALQQIFADRSTGSTSTRASRPTTRWCVGPRASYAPIGPGRIPRMAKQRMREFGALAALTLPHCAGEMAVDVNLEMSRRW
jgi:hypothetical protein